MRLRLISPCCAASVLVPLLAAASVQAQRGGNWFDIGSGEGFAVPCSCSTDRVSEIVFPAYPFGEGYPPGSLVFVGLTQGTEDGFATTYTVLFIDGCGCGGGLVKPITYRFHYEDAALGWPEEGTSVYLREGESWSEVSGTGVDTGANLATFSSTRTLYGYSTYALGPPPPQKSSTWGRIKALYSEF